MTIPDLVGQPVTAYGDSWTASDIENTPGLRAIQQVHAELELGTLTNRAVNGSRAGDAARRAVGTDGTFVPGSAELVVVAVGLNDLLQADTAVQRAATVNHLRALLAVLSAAERIENSAATGVTGTWAGVGPNATMSGGMSASTTTEGATATYAITTPGTYYLLTFGLKPGFPGGPGGILTVTQGGTTLGVVDLDSQHVDTGMTLTQGFGPLALRLENVVAGTLTVTFSTAGRPGAIGYIDAFVRVADTPPTVLAVKPVEVPAALYAMPDLLAHIRSAYDTLAAELGDHVVVCDPATGWNTATMIGPDGIHPNDTGMTHLADAYVAALEAAFAAPGGSGGGPPGPLMDHLRDHVLRGVEYPTPGTVYLHLYTSPTVELAGAGYIGKPVPFSPAGAAGRAESSAAVTFTNLPAATITHSALKDAAGNLLFGPVAVTPGPKTTNAGDSLTFAAGAIDFVFS